MMAGGTSFARTALVTGATDGVGRMVARRLGAMGWRVLVHGRDAGRGAAVVAAIEAAGGSASFLRADFAALAEVRGLADAVEAATDRLHLLVNNAGIGSDGAAGARQESADGIELRFAVNYLPCFLLTHRLLPLLERGAPARIVNVASAGQVPLDFDDVMLTRGYDGWRAYRQSKLAQVLFTFDLAPRIASKGITVNALHPATYMATTMVHRSGVIPTSTVEEGAEAILHLALGADMEGRSGLFFDGLKEARPDPQAFDPEARRRLEALSRALTGVG